MARHPKLASTLPVADDEDLVAAILAGNDEAARAVIERHGPRLLACARRLLGNDPDAEECLQEAFIRIFSKLGSFEGRSGLGTWLYRITTNTALELLRRRKRIEEIDIEELLPVFDDRGCRIESIDESAPLEELLASARTRAFVRARIDELPEGYRTVLLLRDVDEYSTAETATALDISQANVKTRLHRARAALKKLIEPILGGEPCP